MTEQLLGQIRSRGHWRVVIHPQSLVPDRIGRFRDLSDIAERCSVRFRGWNFPHTSVNDESVLRGVDFYGNSVDWEFYLEHWRLYQSGQFVFIGSLHSDWADRSDWTRSRAISDDWRPGGELPVMDAIFKYTEIFEFASRLSLTNAGDNLMHIEVDLIGLEDRMLSLDSSRRAGFFHEYRAQLDRHEWRRDLARDELVGRPRELAVEVCTDLFERFGWEPASGAVASMQSDLRGLDG